MYMISTPDQRNHSQDPMSTTTTIENNVQLASMRLAGDGIAVVFCGGFMSNMNGSKAQALEAWCLEKSIAYCRFDYRGHGQSEGAFEEGNISLWLEDTLSIIDSLTNKQLILVGSSMGAWIAQLACLQRPERVAGLLLLASATDFTRNLIEASLNDVQLRTLKEDGRVLLPSDYDDGSPYAITQQLLHDGATHLLLERPIPITCPVRLVHGTADLDVPWKISEHTLERLQSQDARLLLVKNADHRLSTAADLSIIKNILADLYATIIRQQS